MNDLKEMTVGQLRAAVTEAKTRLEQAKTQLEALQPPCKRWTVGVHRTREITDYRAVVVEAENGEAALAAAIASQDLLGSDGDAWLELDDEVTSFDGDAVDEGNEYWRTTVSARTASWRRWSSIGGTCRGAAPTRPGGFLRATRIGSHENQES